MNDPCYKVVLTKSTLAKAHPRPNVHPKLTPSVNELTQDLPSGFSDRLSTPLTNKKMQINFMVRVLSTMAYNVVVNFCRSVNGFYICREVKGKSSRNQSGTDYEVSFVIFFYI